MLLHERYNPGQAGMEDAVAGARLHALAIARVTDAVMDELLGDGSRQPVAVLEPDQMQHHVERSGAARASAAIAIDGEEAGIDLHLGEALAEAVDTLPVGGGAVAIEQAGAPEDEAARVDSAEHRTFAIEP